VRLGQGREAAKEFLRSHPDTTTEIEKLVREAAGGRPVKTAPASSEEGEGAES
jgi:recombination protein RecA